MKLIFYNYEAYITVVRGLALEGKSFIAESYVNHLPIYSEPDHWTIEIKEVNEE